jgi:hypothetical protein
MAKKARLSKDAFDWVKDTTKEAAEDRSKADEQEKKKPAATKMKTRESAKKKSNKQQVSVPGRTVLIRYQKSGEIVAIAEIDKEEAAAEETLYLDIPGGEQAEVFNLEKGLAKLRLIEIHNRYQVDTSGRKPKLVAKS